MAFFSYEDLVNFIVKRSMPLNIDWYIVIMACRLCGYCEKLEAKLDADDAVIHQKSSYKKNKTINKRTLCLTKFKLKKKIRNYTVVIAGKIPV